MSNGMQIVSFQIVLNAEKIKADRDLAGWCALLEIESDPIDPTWDCVFEKLGRVIIGSAEYQKYCRTGILDQIHYSPYVVNDSVETCEYEEPKKVAAARRGRANTTVRANVSS